MSYELITSELGWLFALPSLLFGIAFWVVGRRTSAKESRGNLKLLLDNMPFGVAVFDAGKKLVLCNRQYAEVYSLPEHLAKPGASQADILQYRVSHGIHAGADPNKYVQDRVSIASENKRKTSILELSSGRVLSVCHCPLETGGWLSTHEDITDRIALQRKTLALSQESERRQKLDEAIASFRSSIALAMRQLCAGAVEMKHTAQELSSSSTNVLESVSRATSQVQHASTGAEVAMHSATELQAAIREIERQLRQATHVVAEAVLEAEKTNQNIASLSTTTEGIGEVVCLIQSIAEQSNLLALNATIEAARAGEAGRGFAVVANEVRALALQTSKAIEGVHQQIKAVQNSASDAIQIIQGIHAGMRRIDQHTSAIAVSIGQQSAATEGITSSIEAAAEGARIASNTFEQASALMTRMQASAESVLSTSSVVDKTAVNLQSEVEEFLRHVAA
jgi:methyl-accepting chemotaxis protein